MRPYTLIALLALCAGFGECDDPRAGLEFAGYTQLSPPSNLFVPGAVVTVQKDAQNRAQLRLLCGPRANLGAHYYPRVSETVSSALKLSKSQRFELEADAVDRFRARTSVEEVASVAVKFSNARVLEADDSEIFRLISNRTDPCTQAIDARNAAGFNVTMVSSAFIADVTYEVVFKRNMQMDKTVAEGKMVEIAGKLGGGHTEVTDHSISAVNLVLAVKVDSFYMTIRPNCAMSSHDRSDDNALPGPVIEADNNADAPLVPPAYNGWVNPVRGSSKN